jgi:hypothetical protein
MDLRDLAYFEVIADLGHIAFGARFAVGNNSPTKPASNCKFSGNDYRRECVRGAQATPWQSNSGLVRPLS